MLCVCHNEPMLWHKDARYRAAGYWSCRVRSRDRFRRWYATNAGRHQERQRNRYDADPVHRIGKRLHDAARKRADTLKRQREALDGPVPQ